MNESQYTSRVLLPALREKFGGHWIKFRAMPGGQRGEPDIQGTVNSDTGWGVPIRIEVKALRGRVSKLQIKTMESYGKAGALVVLFTIGVDDLPSFLNTLQWEVQHYDSGRRRSKDSH